MAAEILSRRLAAILSADVKGYSRLMEDDEEATIHTLTSYRALMAAAITDHGGRVVDNPGDNLLAVFPSVVEATRAAIRIQDELAVRNAELPEDRRMAFRIGINLGDVVEKEGQVFGDGVNIAARVEGLADPGGICLSGSARDQVKNKLPVSLEYLGENAVKNISEPVPVYRLGTGAPAPGSPLRGDTSRKQKTRRNRALFAVALLAGVLGAGATGRIFFRATAPVSEPDRGGAAALPLPDHPSIAVLPFSNMSGDPEQEYFSDGITEDLITDLSKVSGLFVIARNSVFTFKGKPVRVAAVGRELGVRYVLEGSVRRSGDRVRITAQLIDASTGYHLWAERYDRKMQDVFVLQDEVTGKIVSALAVQLTVKERELVGRQHTDSVEAYDHLLRGMEQFRLLTRPGNTRARDLFRSALELDPGYATAYSLLGRTYFTEWAFGWTRDPGVLERAWEFAGQAFDLDDSLPGSALLQGHVLLWRKEYGKAIEKMEAATSLDPNNADGFAEWAEILCWAGRPQAALPLIRKAVRLNPKYPESYLWVFAHAHYLLSDYRKSEHRFRELLARNPAFSPAYVYLAAMDMEQGRAAAAAEKGKTFKQLGAGLPLEAWRERLPYKDDAVAERLFAALRQAGF
jgi:adenylate cyclase